MSIVPPPSEIEITISNTTSTTILLDITATVPGNDYSITVTWRKLHPCPDDNSTMYAPSSLMEYLITGLDEGSTYNITVTVTNEAGSNSSSPVITTTVEAGKTDILTQTDNYWDVPPFAAPSAPPEDISVISSTFSMTVQWKPVPCIHHNGNITGYSIRYHKQGREEEEHQNITIPADNTTVSIDELQPSTKYVIEVAALNSAGTGIYGNIISSTLSCKLYMCTQCHVYVCKCHIIMYAVVTVLSTTPNSITLIWSEVDIVGQTNTIIRWKRSNLCSLENANNNIMSINTTISNMTIAKLEEYSNYNITVSIGNINDSVIAMTNESGM